MKYILIIITSLIFYFSSMSGASIDNDFRHKLSAGDLYVMLQYSKLLSLISNKIIIVGINEEYYDIQIGSDYTQNKYKTVVLQPQITIEKHIDLSLIDPEGHGEWIDIIRGINYQDIIVFKSNQLVGDTRKIYDINQLDKTFRIILTEDGITRPEEIILPKTKPRAIKPPTIHPIPLVIKDGKIIHEWPSELNN